jgi:hypothetical protein
MTASPELNLPKPVSVTWIIEVMGVAKSVEYGPKINSPIFPRQKYIGVITTIHFKFEFSIPILVYPKKNTHEALNKTIFSNKRHYKQEEGIHGHA